MLDCIFCYSFFYWKTKNKSHLEIQVFNEIKFKFMLMYSHFILHVTFFLPKCHLNNNKKTLKNKTITKTKSKTHPIGCGKEAMQK